MADAPIPTDIALSPAGQRLDFILRYLRGGGRELTDEDVEAPHRLVLIKAVLAPARDALRDFELRGVHSPNEQLAIALLERDGRTWRLGVRVEREAPHRLRNVVLAESVPGAEVRKATEADAGILRRIELRMAPMYIG